MAGSGPASSRRDWEEGYRRRGLARVAGLDEAGRGPLAGPVLAAAVILPPGWEESVPIIDSKKLSPRGRERAFACLAATEEIEVGVGRVEADEIDEINILRATRQAMAAALMALGSAPDALLIDGLKLPDISLPQSLLFHGEDESVSIAAASIIAKVTRDRIMVSLDRDYPGYGFARHKGYGTREHLEALKRLGPCPIHRRSFRPVRELC